MGINISYPVCKLKQGRERSLANYHPWVFSGAIAEAPDAIDPGQLVDVVSSDNSFMARGYFNPNSQIRVRVLTFQDVPIDQDFFFSRLQKAINWRKPLLPDSTNAYRICNSEGDYLSGLIVDKYNDYLVAQFLTTGISSFKTEITNALVRIFSPVGIYEKSEGGFRKEEGLPQVSGPLYGEEPPDLLKITEYGLPFYVDLKEGQKTGFFLDQRLARKTARSYADGRIVLNLFGYTGAFTAACLAGGAKNVITVDTSKKALEMAKQNVELNGFDVLDENFIAQDVFQFLRDYRGETDMIILDPPAFAKSKAAVQRASRGYKDINFNSIRLLPESGLMMTHSCSGHVNSDLFQKILFAAAQDAGRKLQILRRIGHDIDHPINIYHPEGDYLTGALCHVGNQTG